MKVIELEKVSARYMQIFRQFVNKFTANDICSFLNKDNLTQPTQMHLSQKQQTFSQFVFAFLKFVLNFEHFQKKMNLRVDVFPKLRTPKGVVR